MKHLAKILPVFLALAMLFGLGCSVNAESITSADATTMRLMRTDGTVLLADGSGSLSVQEGMRLFSGYALSTEALSRAGIMLDDYKAVTLNELSKASLQEEGKKLELNLENGAMYFSVSKPLDADESYSIRTSTMVLGIRGTSGYVAAVSETESIVILTSGHALITAVTGDEQEIAAGQCVTIRLEESGTEFTVSSVTPYDLPSFLLAELAADSAMLAEADSQIGNHFRQTVLELLSPSSAVHSSSSAASGSQNSGAGGNYSDPATGRQQAGVAQSVQDAYEEAYAAAQESYESAVAAAQESFAAAFSNFGF